MSDITKCSGEGCPVKQSCYRFLATPNEFIQSYFSESPYSEGKKDCDHYWDYGNYDANKKSKENEDIGNV